MKYIGIWSLFVILIVGAIITNVMMNNVDLKYDEVNVLIKQAETKKVKNKKTGNTYDFYDVKVIYENEEYDLINVHNTYSYKKGSMVKALKYQDKLYANIEGIKTNMPIAKVYFTCLIGSFVYFFIALYLTGKLSHKKDKVKETINPKN